MRGRTRRLARLGMLAAAALLLSYVESLLPPLSASFPMIKAGLPNIVVLFVLYRFGWGSAAAVSLTRLALSSLLFGSPVTFLYGLSGAAVSLALMGLMRRSEWFSPVGVSVAGGVSHNAGQTLAAILLTDTPAIGYAMIVLTVSGTLAGALVGLAASLALRYVPPAP